MMFAMKATFSRLFFLSASAFFSGGLFLEGEYILSGGACFDSLFSLRVFLGATPVQEAAHYGNFLFSSFVAVIHS